MSFQTSGDMVNEWKPAQPGRVCLKESDMHVCPTVDCATDFKGRPSLFFFCLYHFQLGPLTVEYEAAVSPFLLPHPSVHALAFGVCITAPPTSVTQWRLLSRRKEKTTTLNGWLLANTKTKTNNKH